MRPRLALVLGSSVDIIDLCLPELLENSILSWSLHYDCLAAYYLCVKRVKGQLAGVGGGHLENSR